MKKLAGNNGFCIICAVLFFAGLFISFVFNTLALHAKNSDWHQDGISRFEDTYECWEYVNDGNNYVYQNIIWLEDLSMDYLGSYAGSSYSYVIKDEKGHVTADTTSEESVYIDSIYVSDMETDNDSLSFQVDGYITYPITPYSGCFSEYILFRTFFGIRNLMPAFKYISLAVSLFSFYILCMHAFFYGKKNALYPAYTMPAEFVFIFSVFAGIIGFSILSKYLAGRFHFSGMLLFPLQSSIQKYIVYSIVFFIIWYIVRQIGLGLFKERSLLVKIPLIVLVVIILIFHIFFLFSHIYLTATYSDYFLYDYTVKRIFAFSALFLIVADSFLLFLAIRYWKEASLIKQASQALSDGDLSYKTDTDHLHYVWNTLGSNLNSISSGMSQAVEARMKSERMKTELITNVSHDLKTPITSIVNYVGLLKNARLDEETREEYLDVLDRQSARLKKLTEDVIEASKAASGVIQTEMETIDAVELLDQFSGEYEAKLSEAQVTPVLTISTKDAFIHADSTLLGRVMDNIFSNIIKYSQPGTRAYFDLSAEDGYVVMMFKNVSREPLNISADELMERFVRGDSSRHTEGSGLGLSIARSLTELMGGNMDILLDGDLFKTVIRFPEVLPAEMDPET